MDGLTISSAREDIAEYVELFEEYANTGQER